MALQTGAGLSKIVILVGAGYTSTVLFKNGKLSDVLGELQAVVKGLEKSGIAEGDPDYSDAIASQVRRLAAEVRQLASARHTINVHGCDQTTTTTYINYGSITPLLVPAAALGALGYVYMWWKGLSFSDLMYVTKSNMANAVSNLTKHLEHVSEALAATKRHLTQRIENLDGKLDDQLEISKLIKTEVTDVRGDLSQIGYDLDALQRMVSGLDGKICSLADRQDLANRGVLYLCNFVNRVEVEMSEVLQEQLKLSGKSRGCLTASETSSLKGLKEITDYLEMGNASRSITDGSCQDSTEELDDPPTSPTSDS
ncbi:uncharacterized protein LOC131311393 isoform X2 [Rhododendron vialii]|uniref:uncharacterized protein LOC131311393 isoform X2 n=1 Tax=Rhododendron vialii TaxID=182163 RepID=UPI00265EF60D|nr:uncharacterized protein LOC131311393 isoform X2 [Rhododendron vialii]